MDCRLDRAIPDDQSCTERPASGAAVGLATSPHTVTLPLGRAMVGAIDVIAIHGCGCAAERLTAAVTAARVPAAGAAAAGTAGSIPAPAAAASAASRRPRLRPRCR